MSIFSIKIFTLAITVLLFLTKKYFLKKVVIASKLNVKVFKKIMIMQNINITICKNFNLFCRLDFEQKRVKIKATFLQL